MFFFLYIIFAQFNCGYVSTRMLRQLYLRKLMDKCSRMIMEKDDMEMGGHQHMKTNRIMGTLYNTNENSAEYFLSNGFR